MALPRSSLLLTALGVVIGGCNGGEDAARVGADRAALRGAPHASNDRAVLALLTDDGPFCTATLIAPRVALTAAHCVSDLDRDAHLEVAEDGLSGDATRVSARVLAIAPGYRSDATGADLALLALDAALDDVTPLEVFAGALDSAALRTVRHVGFSDARRTTATQDVVAVTAVEIAVAEGDARPCFGDSGGPALAVVGDPARERIVGVISRAAPGDRDCTGATTWDSRTDPFASWMATEIARVADEEEVHETSEPSGCSAAPPLRRRAAFPTLAALMLATFRRRRMRCTLDGS